MMDDIEEHALRQALAVNAQLVVAVFASHPRQAESIVPRVLCAVSEK